VKFKHGHDIWEIKLAQLRVSNSLARGVAPTLASLGWLKSALESASN
jgi:hypothetical protein